MVSPLAVKASARTLEAFRPKTRRAYDSMFRVFVAFCIYSGVIMLDVNLKVILPFMECLVSNHCSCAMIENYLSAIKAKFILFELPFVVFSHPKIKYFVRSLKINRPLTLKAHNLIDLSTLRQLSKACSQVPNGQVYRAVILTGFFAFMRLSNLAPHSLASFDPTRHLTGHDVFFTKNFVKLLIKWSKTLQTRDKVQCVTLPKLQDSLICPYRALKTLFHLYSMSPQTSLFQLHTTSGSNPLTDSRVRKTLKTLNLNSGLHPTYFTFHDFRRSGATFAYNSHIPIQQIKRHGTWSSDCVWQYIQSDHSSGEGIAVALASTINAAL